MVFLCEGDEPPARFILKIIDDDIRFDVAMGEAVANGRIVLCLTQFFQTIARAERRVDRFGCLKLLHPVRFVFLPRGAVGLVLQIELQLFEIAPGIFRRLDVFKLLRAVQLKHIAVETHESRGIHRHVMNLQVNAFVIVRQADHFDLVHRIAVHLDRHLTPAPHFLMRIFFPP